MTCRKLASAAAKITARAKGLKLAGEGTFSGEGMRVAVGGPPFQAWGEQVLSLQLSQHRYTLAACPRPASRLQTLRLTHEDKTTAEALSQFSAQHFPAAPAHVCVCFSMYKHATYREQAMAPNALIELLSHQHRLASLTLQFLGSRIGWVSLTTLLVHDLSIHFELTTDLRLNLGWLKRQPFQSLELCINIKCGEGFSETHQQVVEQLRQLSISTLTLRFHKYVPAQIQTLWQQVRVSQRCTLQVLNVFDAGICQARALRFLPCCPDISIHAPNFNDAPKGLQVAWAALCNPGRISFHLGSRQALWFSKGCALPAELQNQAWQLVVHSAKEVRGLHGALHRNGVQYLQTRAAELAGWTVA